MELALTVLVLGQVVSHILIKTLLLLLKSTLHSVVVPLLLIVVDLDLSKLIPQSSKALNLGGQLLFLLLDLSFNALNE